MILVILGTQDKDFSRLLQAVEKEIKKGHIQDRVVVQAGQTHYESSCMEIFDLLPAPEFDQLMDEADLIITHGGAGSILSAIKKGKKVIAAARLAKYGEHHNDHQKQIIGEFSKQGYILELKDFQKLDKIIEKSKAFRPKKFVSNTQHVVKLLENYIDDTNHISWYNRYYSIIVYLFFGTCATFLNIFTFLLLRKFQCSLFISNIIAWIVAFLFAFVTNKYLVFESKKRDFSIIFREFFSFFLARLFSFFVDMGLLYYLVEVLSLSEFLSKVLVNIVVIIMNYVFSKKFVFRT